MAYCWPVIRVTSLAVYGAGSNCRPAADTAVGVTVCVNFSVSGACGAGFLSGADARSPGSEDGQCCTICFEPWSNSGEHRIAALRCGHLFGKACIERWLRGREQRCPQCNAKVRGAALSTV